MAATILATDPGFDRTTCIGSGVPNDFWEWGHTVMPGTARLIFPRPIINRDGLRIGIRKRCKRCESHRYTYFKRLDFRKKAQATFNSHAEKMVKRGFSRTVDEAKLQLILSGVTVDFIAATLLAAVDQPCPGFCGWPERHIITDDYDCQLDWRDPRSPLTPENCGPLCASCNQQKGEQTWAEFMASQRAIRYNLQHATALDPPLTLDLIWPDPDPP